MERKKYPTAEFKEIDNSKPKKKGQVWCPYEGEWKFFKPRSFKDEGYGYPRCEGCGISTEDYWVKTSNKLWGDLGIKPRK